VLDVPVPLVLDDDGVPVLDVVDEPEGEVVLVPEGEVVAVPVGVAVGDGAGVVAVTSPESATASAFVATVVGIEATPPSTAMFGFVAARYFLTESGRPVGGVSSSGTPVPAASGEPATASP